MIQTKGLGYEYANGAPFIFPDIQLQKGEALLILGQSGVGKTTFLHLLGLLLKPTKGNIFINNEEVTRLKSSELTHFRSQNLGIIFQKPHFVASLSVKENLLLANYLSGKNEDESRMTNLATTLGFLEHIHKKTSQLSLGEQQRVAIARALMNNPAVILADEPTSSLDDENCQNVIDLLQKQSEKIGASLIIVTHDQRLKNVFANQIFLKK